MSNAITGIWSGLGALVGGVAGAYAGRYAAKSRPRHTYGSSPHDIEDAMVVGGAAGALVGAFVAATVTSPSEEKPAPQVAPVAPIQNFFP